MLLKHHLQVGCAMVSLVACTHASATDYVVTDDASVPSAILDGSNNIRSTSNDTVTIDYVGGSPISKFTRFRAQGHSLIDFRNGMFENIVMLAQNQGSIHIHGGEFIGATNYLRLREGSSSPSPGEEGRIQLFVQDIFSIEDAGGADLGAYYPGFTENFTIDLPPGYGSETEIRISGTWSNGDAFTDLRIQALSDHGGSINVWQSQPVNEYEDAEVNTQAVGDVTVDLITGGDEGGVSATFDPLDNGGTTTFSAEYLSGHNTQLQGLLDERGIPTILPEVADNESFDIWFLDYLGDLEQGDITLELSFDPSEYNDPSSLVVYHYDETLGAWEELTGTIDETNGTITIVTDNLSPFLLGEAGAVPEPGTLGLVVVGLSGLGLRRRRK